MPSGPSSAVRIFLCACVALITLGSEAFAQSRPLTSRMSCGQARSLVAAQGAVILSTSPLAYDRYVGSAGSCSLGERAEPAWIPTADNRQCSIGYRCVIGTTPSRN
jgi:hypothetical protein